MAISNFLKIVVAHSVQGEECTGCGMEFAPKDIRKVYKTTTNHFFCEFCYKSDFEMEAYANLIEV